MPKVLIADQLSPRAAAIMRERGLVVEEKVGLPPEALAAAVADVDGLAVRSATKVPAAVIHGGARLKVIGRAGIGVDTIDVGAATQAGVVVMNTPFGNSITTAEHALAMMFALARQLPAADRSTQAGKWEKSRFMGVELFGKTLGVIGCGNIGTIVADRARGLRMKVAAYDPFLSVERAIDIGVEKLDLDTLLARADFITLHTPLTAETRNLLDRKAFQKMKPGVRIVNCARGGLIVEDDLKWALDQKIVAGAALDVFAVEPAKDNPLFGDERVICTPHLGASTAEAQENVAVQIAEQMADFLLTGAVSNAVNMPSLTAEEAPRLRPYMKLAEMLGRFAGQITMDGVQQFEIGYQGDAAHINHRPVTAAAVAGLMARGDEVANMVSAPVIARERGVRIVESRDETAGDYQTLLRLTVTTDKGALTLTGTLVHGGRPRIVDIQGMPLEAELGRHMLYMRNRDVPGMVGRVGGALGAAGVNIATFHLGRSRAGDTAVVLSEVDHPVPEAVIAELRAIPNVLEVTPLVFF
jgi:D-3-phosphoglycerate dehydrogenase